MDILSSDLTASDLLAAAPSWHLSCSQLLDMMRCDWRREVLGNGLVVLLNPDPSTALIRVGVGYRVGSMDEGPGQTGLAHLFEHLMFGGTKQLPGSYLARMTELGATGVNAMTGRDTTRYYQTIPAHMLDYLLFAEADRMGNFLDGIDGTVLERERKVVLEEKRENEGKLLGKLYNWLAEGMLAVGHPYRHPVIGYTRDVSAFTLDDIRRWYATHYGPSNAVLVIGGGIDADAALALAERHFGHIPAIPRPERITGRVETVVRNSAMRVFDRIGVPAIFYQGWSTPSVVASPRESIAISLASDMLGGGRSSVLHQCLVEELGLATQTSSFHLEGQVAGTFTVNASLKAKPDHQIGTAISDAIMEFASQTIAPERMDLIRANRLSSAVRMLGAFERRAMMLMDGEILHEDPSWFHRQARLVATIEERDVRAAVRTWLGSGAFHLSIEPVPHYRAAPCGPLAIPTVGDPAAATILSPEWTEAILSNGARVRISHRPDDAAYFMRISVAGGQAAEPPGMEGMAAMVASAPAVGAGEDDNAALADRAMRASLTFNMGATLTSVNLDVDGLRGGLPSAIALVADALIRPRYDTPKFARHMASAIANAATNADTAAQRARLAQNHALLGASHRLAAATPISPDLGARVGAADVRRFHESMLQPKDAVVMIAGDVDPAEAVALLELALADWRAPAAEPTMTPMPRRLGLAPALPGIRLFDTPGQSSAQITLLWRTGRLSDADRVAFNAVAHALCGGYGSRANIRLREEKAWTYGVQGGTGAVAPTIGPDYAMLQTAISADHVAVALAELEALIEAMRSTDPVRDAEIEQFRLTERSRMARLNETPRQAVQTMQQMYDDGFAGAADWNRHRNHVEELTEPMLARISSLLLPAPAQLICTILGDAAKIRTALASAGFAPRIIEEGEG